MNVAEKKPSRVWAFVVAVGVIAGALAIVPQLAATRQWIARQWKSWGAVDLPGSYPAEIWKAAPADDFAWLAHEWCFPTLRGFRSRFKVEQGSLYRKNLSAPPDAFETEWVRTETYLSNRGVLRMQYLDKEWHAGFIYFEASKPFE